MGKTIKLKRGTVANLPDLAEGEPGWATDTEDLYLGNGTATPVVIGGTTQDAFNLKIAANLSDLASAATARTNLGVKIGTDVQAYDSTILVDADIGVTVQGYTVYDQTTFDALASIAASTNVTFAAGTYAVTADMTIPVYASLNIPAGVTITISTTKTLTIEGYLNAGQYQIFSHDNTDGVAFSNGLVLAVSPEWFGINTTPGTTDVTTPVQSAIDSLKTVGGKVSFGATHYKVSALLMNSSDYDGIILEGVSEYFTRLTFTTTGTGLTMGVNPGSIQYATVRNFRIDSSTTNILISLINGTLITFEHLRIQSSGSEGATSYGFKLYASMGTVFNSVAYSGDVDATYGIYVADDSDGTVIRNCYIKGEATASDYSIVLDGATAHVNTVIADSIIGGASLASILIAGFTETNLVKITNNYFEGSVVGIQIGNNTGPLYGRNLTIEGNYFYATSDSAILLSASRNVSIKNNYFVTCLLDIEFHATATNNAYVIIELNIYSAGGISIGAAQTNVRYEDANKYVHDRLSALDNTSGDVWNPGSIAVGARESKDVTITGAALQDFAIASFNLDIVGLTISAAVKSADTVTVTLANNTAGAVDLASGIVCVRVYKR